MADDSDKPDFLTFWNGPEGDRMRRDLRHPRQPFPEELADRLEPYRGKPIPEALFDYLLVTLRGGVRRRSGHLARDPHEARDRATALRFAMEDYPGYLARVQQCKKRLRQSGKRKATANALWQEPPRIIAAHLVIRRWRPLQGLSPLSFLNELSKLKRRQNPHIFAAVEM